MTLLRIGLAFLVIATLFVGIGWVTGARKRGNAAALAAEALFLTLVGSLWFASLGHGGWVLVFALLGLVASAATGAAGSGMKLFTTALTTARYVVAGAVLLLLVG